MLTSGTGAAHTWHDDPAVWRFVLGRYLTVFALLNLLWEIAQLPLYTLWREAPPAFIAYAVIHCTLGDVLIGVLALLAALVATRAGRLRQWCWRRTGAVAIAFGFAYTAFSEWLNTAVWANWAYSEWMPLTPFVPLGVSPLLQWLVVPAAALIWARRHHASGAPYGNRGSA
ncbi:MAG: hypothetical protein CVU20_03350 [Betaproteobacteria bacterium HGW-Betaproteobacteria-14]|nr:MAG: hypothetical protein CVU20_03350 [Betaproteobacteria bacterium HGW-Betaproteobacteria-14]